MNLSEAFTRFIALEEKQDFWSLRFAGTPIWQAIRMPVFDAVSGALGLTGRRHSARPYGYKQSLLRAPRAFADVLRRNVLWQLTERDVLIVSHPRYQETPAGWLCPYTAPLLPAVRHSKWLLGRSDKGHYYQPEAVPDVRYLDGLYWAANVELVAKRAGEGTLWLHSEERRTAHDITESLAGEFGVSVSTELVEKLILREKRHLLAYRDGFARLLQRIRPKVVILVCYYSGRTLPLVEAAALIGIPVVELQHGTVSADHIAYSFAPGRRPNIFPDYFLTFGDFWRDQLNRSPLSPQNMPPIGFAWLEQAVKAVRPTRDQSTVLFISQNTIGDKLGLLAAAVAPELVRRGYRVLYKLHPGEAQGWQQRMPVLAQAPLEVIDGPRNIHELFAEATLQVGVYSTAIFEGVAFGLKTFVVALPGHEALLPLIQIGAAQLVASGEELVAKLDYEPREGDAVDSGVSNAAVSAFLWRPNAVQNFTTFLDELLD